MRCNNCGCEINPNLPQCPYCKTPVNVDNFGYERSEQMRRVREDASVHKKDNSSKVVFIILGVIFGLFAVVAMMIVMFTAGSSPSDNKQMYDGKFSVKPDFVFSITDTADYEFSVAVDRIESNGSSEVDRFKLNRGEERKLYLVEGIYKITVMKELGDQMVLEASVQNDSEYDSAELQYNDRQLQLKGKTVENTPAPQTQSSTTANKKFYIPKKAVYIWNDSSIETMVVDCPKSGEMNIENIQGGSKYAIKYNGKGRISEYTSSSSYGKSRTVITYNSNGNILTNECDGSLEYKYEYDSLNRPVKKIFESGWVDEYSYDGKSNRISRVKSDCGDPDSVNLIELEYNSAGNLAKETHYYDPDDPDRKSSYTYTYDGNSRLIREELMDNSHFELDGTGERKYTYDSAGRITEETYTFSSEFETQPYKYSKKYKYDSNGRVVEVTERSESSEQSAPYTAVIAYSYDGNGNVVGINAKTTYDSGEEYKRSGTYEYMEVDELAYKAFQDIQRLSYIVISYDMENVAPVIKEPNFTEYSAPEI